MLVCAWLLLACHVELPAAEKESAAVRDEVLHNLPPRSGLPAESGAESDHFDRDHSADESAPASRGFIFADLFEAPAPRTKDSPPPSEPDISEPGPDMGDFPNSAYTLPAGRSYIEYGLFSIAGGNDQNPPTYSGPFLLRYGVTDDVEFRLLSSGIISEYGEDRTTGFSPLILDMKVHLWNGRKEWFIPASSLEVTLQTPWGSPAFNFGTRPGLNMNFDLRLHEKTNLEWTIGYGSVQDPVRVISGATRVRNQQVPVVRTVDMSYNQLSAQWAVEQDLTDEFQIFVHGYYLGAVPGEQGISVAVGAGMFYKFSKRCMGFGSCNAGLTQAVSPVFAQVGFAYAL